MHFVMIKSIFKCWKHSLEANCYLHNNSPKAKFSNFTFTPHCILVSTLDNVDKSQGKKGALINF